MLRLRSTLDNYWRFFDLVTTLFTVAGLFVAMIDYEISYVYDQSNTNDPRSIATAKNSPLRLMMLILTLLAITTILLRHGLKARWLNKVRLAK